MSNHEFILKSGEKLQITTASFEAAVELIEAVKKATLGIDPTLSVDDVVLADPAVRKALYPCFNSALWGIHKVSTALFDDLKFGEKARGDYFEICSRVIEVNSRPFFLNLFSKSTTIPPTPQKSPELP